MVLTSGISGGSSSSIATLPGFASQHACLVAAIDFLGDRVESIGHGYDVVREARCLSMVEQPGK